MTAHQVLIIEPGDDGTETITAVGPFTSAAFAHQAAFRFRSKRDAAGLTQADVRVYVSKQIAPDAFQWTPPSQRPRAEVIELTRQRKHRKTDPQTSAQADLFASNGSISARRRLIEAHAAHPNGLTDEEAALIAGLSMSSEYSTRCSELKRDGILEDTPRTRVGSTGLQRTVRQMTAAGVDYWREQKAATK